VTALQTRLDVYELARRQRATTRGRKREESPIDVWSRLAALVDPAEFRPKLADDIEVKEFKLRWGNDYAMLANPRDLLHYRIEPGEIELVRLMDGTRTVKEIVVQRFQESGDLEFSGVADLVRQLHVGNFLDQPFLDVDEAVKRAINPITERRQKARQFASTLSIEWKGADRLVQFLYRNFVRAFFNKFVAVVGLAVSIAGFLAFISIVRSNRFSLSGKSLALGFLILLALNYVLTFAHELGHASVLARYGRHVKSAGFLIYFGSPAFFVDSSDGLMLGQGPRIVQSAAGPYSEMILAGGAALVVWAFPGATIASVLYKFVVLNYLVIFMNLVPLLELDGYWLLADAIQVPDLRPRSLSFIRHDLWHKLRNRARFSRQEIGLAFYGIVGVLFTIFSFYTAYFFWKEVFGGLVIRLWDGGVVTRVLLFVLGLLVLGPVLRGAINLARALARRWQALWLRIRFRLESKWRIEAAELIDELPLFDDVPVEALNELAGSVRLRTFARGAPVVRQGDRAEAFYVVRRGTLTVVEEDPDTGNERTIRILGRGESFGELALAKSAVRSATVRAVEESEVFEIGKSTFDHLLADMIHLPDFGPTLQAVAELKELRCFSYLEPDELTELLAHGEWINVSPGTTVVKQGEVSDAFYAVGDGQMEVWENGKVRRTLGPGSFFGEIGLLFDVARTATVRSRTPARLFRLDREGFDRIVREAFRRGTLNPATPQARTWQH